MDKISEYAICFGVILILSFALIGLISFSINRITWELAHYDMYIKENPLACGLALPVKDNLRMQIKCTDAIILK